MKTTTFLIICLNFLSGIIRSWPPLLLEFDRWESPGKIIASTLSESQGYLFLSVQDIESNKILFFEIAENTFMPNLIAQIEKDSPVYLILHLEIEGKILF